MKHLILILFISILAVGLKGQGSFDPAVGIQGSLAIAKDSSIIQSWASSCIVQRGYKDISNKSMGKVNYGRDEYGTGFSNTGAVSLGDSGIATLTFEGIVYNDSGPDFCVFENSFNDNFLEFAFVEVSSDGVNFFRFPAVSEVDTSVQVGSFDLIEATDIHNLAGKHRAQYGTPFDLSELMAHPELNTDSISHIRLIDVIGSIDAQYASRDSRGNIINDPYPTDFQNQGFYTGGFDIEAVGLIHYTGEKYTGVQPVVSTKEFNVFPNPTSDIIRWNSEEPIQLAQVLDLSGQLMINTNDISAQSIDVSDLPYGVYTLRLSTDKGTLLKRFIVE